jgi:hypothetical protein
MHDVLTVRNPRIDGMTTNGVDRWLHRAANGAQSTVPRTLVIVKSGAMLSREKWGGVAMWLAAAAWLDGWAAANGLAGAHAGRQSNRHRRLQLAESDEHLQTGGWLQRLQPTAARHLGPAFNAQGRKPSTPGVVNRGSMSTGTPDSRFRTLCTGGRTTPSSSIIERARA